MGGPNVVILGSPVWASRGVLGKAGDSYDEWLEAGIAGTAKLLSG